MFGFFKLLDPLKPLDFKVLRDTSVESYFTQASGDSSPRVSDLAHLTFDADVLNRFHHDFERLLFHRKGIQGLSNARAFHRWWLAHRALYVTRPMIENYKKSGLTLGDFLDDLHIQFLLSQRKSFKRFGWFGYKLSIPVLIGATVLVNKFLNFALSLLILGPGVQMVNSYSQPVITPLAQTASQYGAKDLSALTFALQNWLMRRATVAPIKEELQEVNFKLKQLDFKNMSPEQIQAKWLEFESVYFKLFQAYNQTLPQHLREGRSYMKDWMIFTPVSLSSHLATFDVQYWMHANARDALLKRKSSLSSAERAKLRIHEDEMTASEDRIASVLAAWKLFEFMYPEFTNRHNPATRNIASDSARATLTRSYESFVRHMHFDRYVEKFSQRVAEVLAEMDADSLMHQ